MTNIITIAITITSTTTITIPSSQVSKWMGKHDPVTITNHHHHYHHHHHHHHHHYQHTIPGVQMDGQA
jgi:hypothetical protein